MSTTMTDIDLDDPRLWNPAYLRHPGVPGSGRLWEWVELVRRAESRRALAAGRLGRHAGAHTRCECGGEPGVLTVPGTIGSGPWCVNCVRSATEFAAEWAAKNPPAPPDPDVIDLADPAVRAAVRVGPAGEYGSMPAGVELLRRPATVRALRAGEVTVWTSGDGLPMQCAVCGTRMSERRDGQVGDDRVACGRCVDEALAALARVDEARSGLAVA